MFLTRLKQTIDKKRTALTEDFSLEKFLRPQKYVIENEPFPFMVADNFFTDEVYEDLCRYFKNLMARGFSEQTDHSRFHPFLTLTGKFQYDGYSYAPQFKENKALDIFFSVQWNLFFSKLFNQPTDWNNAIAIHHHPPGNKTGFVHADYVPRNFSYVRKLPNGIIPNEAGDPKGGPQQANITTSMRIISLIYYLNNDGWKRGDGGETGLYLTKEGVPAKLIEPLNNRLLAFHISPESFHAFQKNFISRSSIVQWFHVDAEWCQKKYGFV